MTARPLAPEADLARVLHLAKKALQQGHMIDPEELLCDLLGLDEEALQEWLDQADDFPALPWEPDPNLRPGTHWTPLGYTLNPHEQGECGDPFNLGRSICRRPNQHTGAHSAQPAEPDRSQPAATRAQWRQAEAGTVQHLVLWDRALCAAEDAGPWRVVAGVDRCPACAELEDVLARHG